MIAVASPQSVQQSRELRLLFLARDPQARVVAQQAALWVPRD